MCIQKIVFTINCSKKEEMIYNKMLKKVEKVAIIAERNYYITRLQGLCLSKHVGAFISCMKIKSLVVQK